LSNFWQAVASRGFVSDSWASCYYSRPYDTVKGYYIFIPVIFSGPY